MADNATKPMVWRSRSRSEFTPRQEGPSGMRGQEPVPDEKDMGKHKNEEDRGQYGNRLLHAPEVQHHEQHHQENDEGKLELVQVEGKKAENRVAAGGEGDGDGENIVDEKGGARNARPCLCSGYGSRRCSPPPPWGKCSMMRE